MEGQSKEEMAPEMSRTKAAEISFQKVIGQIEKSEWRKALSRAAKNYNIKVYSLEKLTLNRVKEIYHTIAEKFYVEERTKDNWNENELRVYVWLLFAFANSLGKSPEDFSSENWSELAGCFLGKSVHLCEFQYNSLKKLSDKVVKWSEEEDELLTSILNEREIKNRWNEIAKQLFLRSSKRYFRTSKQCRERWNNYLDPTKSHASWTPQQDILLIRAVYDKGKKWALISKLLDSRRTEHMVKNRFNSLMCKFQKASNRRPSADNVSLEEFLGWLGSQNQKDSPRTLPRSPKDTKEGAVKVQGPQEPAPASQPVPQKQSVMPLPQKKDFSEKLTHSTVTAAIPYEKSPIMLFSPVAPAYTPLVFSPYNDFGNIFIYQNQTESAEHSRLAQSPIDPSSMLGINYFSFENLQRRY